MPARSPHFLLFSDASSDARRSDRWRFVLQSVGGEEYLAAEDSEPGTHSSRLELLAVVRGLEALDQPSRVTLVTRSRYVRRGIHRGLSQWRARRWRWEHFGELVPIRDHDLWQRVDRAMRFHEVVCCPWLTESLDESLEVAEMRDAPSVVASLEDDVPILPVRDLDKSTADREHSAERPEAAELAACKALTPAESEMILTPSRRRPERRKVAGSLRSLAGTFARLRQNVLAPLTHLCRPAFTRAA